MDQVQHVKGKARVLATYLKEIHRPIKHGQALDAMARIEGHRDWNTFAAAGNASAQNLSSSAVQLTTVVDGSRSSLVIDAFVYSDDGFARTHFDAAPWFDQASDADIQALLEIDCHGDYAADAVAEFIRDEKLDADVVTFFDHQELMNSRAAYGESIGFEVSVDEHHVWRYLRAFRFGLFTRLVLQDQFETLEKASTGGYGIHPDVDQPSMWYFELAGTKSDISYPSNEAAWEALGLALEQAPSTDDQVFTDPDHPGSIWFRTITERTGEGLLAIKPNSGARGTRVHPDDPKPVPGRHVGELSQPLVHQGPPLTTRQLKVITDHGKHYVDIVIEVEFWDLMQNDVEWFNDEASALITGSEAGLQDINYEVFNRPGAPLFDSVVRVRVIAGVDFTTLDDEDSLDESSED